MTEEKVSRRSYVKYVGGVVVVAVVAAAGYGIYQYTKPAPKELVLFMHTGSPQTRFAADSISKFKERTGISVKLVETPYEDMDKKMMTELVAGTGAFDVCGIDSSWFAGAAPYLEPLEDLYTEEDRKDFLAAAVEMCKYKGPILAVPYLVNNLALYCRTDLFEKAGISPPSNWEELLAAAQKLTDPSADVWGFAMEGARTAQAAEKFLCWAYQAGGGLLDEAGNVIINSEASVKALQFMVDLVHKYKVALPDAPEMTFVECHNAFLQGRAAMLDNWSYMISLADDPSQSKVVGKYQVVPLPKGVRGGTCVAGWQFVVPKDSKHKAEAKEFIKWITSVELQKELLKYEGAARLTVSNPSLNPDVTKYNRWYPVFMNSMAEFGFLWPAHPKLMDAIDKMAEAINTAMTLQKTPKEALDAAAPKIKEIFGS